MFRQNGQQKHATLFQNELKNNVAGFTTLIQTCEPLSPNGDQDQFSHNNIHTLSTDKLWE